MKKWNAPAMEELNINETAYHFFGKYNDGGYVGDGILSGHSTNKKPNGNSGSGSAGGEESTDSLS